MTETVGAIFATTGKDYTELAERAARSVKESCPGLEVDLFTDQQVQMPVFDRIHQLDDPWRRSKMDAMLLSRFDRTLYLDADLFVIADIRDVFEVLDRFDMAMVQDQYLNGGHAQTIWRKPFPNAFPHFNGGVVAFRRSPEVIELIKSWSVAVRENDLKRDQPVLRELVWDSDLRVATLPPEYNLMRFEVLSLWDEQKSAAPRIIHSPKLHSHFTSNRKKERFDSLEDLLGSEIASKRPIMLSADKGLARMAGREPTIPGKKKRKVRKRLRQISDIRRQWLGF